MPCCVAIFFLQGPSKRYHSETDRRLFSINVRIHVYMGHPLPRQEKLGNIMKAEWDSWRYLSRPKCIGNCHRKDCNRNRFFTSKPSNSGPKCYRVYRIKAKSAWICCKVVLQCCAQRSNMILHFYKKWWKSHQRGQNTNQSKFSNLFYSARWKMGHRSIIMRVR